MSVTRVQVIDVMRDVIEHVSGGISEYGCCIKNHLVVSRTVDLFPDSVSMCSTDMMQN